MSATPSVESLLCLQLRSGISIKGLTYFVFVSAAMILSWKVFRYLWIVFLVILMTEQLSSPGIGQDRTPSASQPSPKLEGLFGVFRSRFLQ